ncbi:MAG: sensor histidine kinase [Thaumarchaeota archaeon]|nr:sensor histidine kinase [Nitrososphaerota archaeon]
MIGISTQIISIFLLVTAIFVIFATFSITTGQDFIQQSVGQSSLLLAQDMARFIEFGVSNNINDLIDFSKTDIVQKTLLESNQEFENLSDIQDYIDQQDDAWVSTPYETITPFMQSLISNELAEDLKKNFVEKINPRTGHSAFAELFLTNEYGANVAQSGKTTDYRQDDEDWWQEAKANGISIGKTEYDESAKTDIISIGIKITDEDGNFAGVLKAGLSVRSIIREAEIFTQYEETTQVNIITEEGHLIYSTKAFRFNENISDHSFFEKLQSGQQGGFFVDEGEFKKELVAYSRPSNLQVMGEQDWIFVIKHEIGEVGILSGMLTLRDRMIINSLIIVGVAIVGGIIFSRSISHPIKKLTYLAKEIGKENFDVKVNLKGRGEIAQLVKNMQEMGIALKNAKKDKDEFIAMISHELKTPLTPIKIYATTLKKPKAFGELNQKQIEAVDGIHFNALRLERLIEDLLDVQRLETGRMMFLKEKFSVNEVLDEAVKDYQIMSQEKNIQISSKIDGKIILYSDKKRIDQVLDNLARNSIDFVPKNTGTIQIFAEKNNDNVLFTVKDNGQGISKEAQKKLFAKFYQADTSVTRRHGGTGLGLAICKGIVEGLGGEIWLESEEGKGTNVYFTIPNSGLQ